MTEYGGGVLAQTGQSIRVSQFGFLGGGATFCLSQVMAYGSIGEFMGVALGCGLPGLIGGLFTLSIFCTVGANVAHTVAGPSHGGHH